MKPYRILVINPGSTSTKLAIYEDEKKVWGKSTQHPAEELAKYQNPVEQRAFREKAIRDFLAADGIAIDFDAIIARGGLLRPTPGGVYLVDAKLDYDLRHAKLEHACNLGGLLACDLAKDCGCPAFIADPEVVDEMIPEAKVTGVPEIRRMSIFHALNTKAIGRRYAAERGLKYEDLNLLMVHLGGGISVSAHRKGLAIDTNNALNGDGPFTPERAGSVPSDQLVEMCFSGKFTKLEIKKKICGKGGCAAHLGTTDMIEIENRAMAGEEPFKFIFEAMAYNVAKDMGAMAVALEGKMDAIIITGGIAHCKPFIELLRKWAGFLGPFTVMAGEDEMGYLAMNALAVLRGQRSIVEYLPGVTIEQLQAELN